MDPEQASRAAKAKGAKRKKAAEKSTDKNKWLFKRSVDHKAPWDRPRVTFTDLSTQTFRDVYGDRSGSISWRFHDTHDMFMVRRKSGNNEFYKDAHDFNSFTKVDLIELSKAPFSNPSKNPKASKFKSFLEDQVAKGFPSMKTAESFVAVHKYVLEMQRLFLFFENVIVYF